MLNNESLQIVNNEPEEGGEVEGTADGDGDGDGVGVGEGVGEVGVGVVGVDHTPQGSVVLQSISVLQRLRLKQQICLDPASR